MIQLSFLLNNVSLASARLQLAAIPVAKDKPSSAIMLDKASDQIGRSLEQIRNVLLDLSSPILQQMGLSAGLSEWLDRHARDKHGLETTFSNKCGDLILSYEIRLLLYRNVCELLVNVIRHARARKVSVSTARSGQSLQIVVEDDGVGFEPASEAALPSQAGGFGMFSISVRMADMGGSLEMEPAPGHGCKATLVAPLEYTAEGIS